MPTVTFPIPDHESSQVRSAWSARSYEGIEHPAKPTAARRSWPRWSGTRLLDHVVCLEEKRLRNGEAEGFRSLEVDDQLELRRLLDGQVAGLGALEDLVHVDGGAPPLVAQTGPIGHQAARLHVLRDGADRREPVPQRELSDLGSHVELHGTAGDDERVGSCPGHRGEHALQLA